MPSFAAEHEAGHGEEGGVVSLDEVGGWVGGWVGGGRRGEGGWVGGWVGGGRRGGSDELL